MELRREHLRLCLGKAVCMEDTNLDQAVEGTVRFEWARSLMYNMNIVLTEGKISMDMGESGMYEENGLKK